MGHPLTSTPDKIDKYMLLKKLNNTFLYLFLKKKIYRVSHASLFLQNLDMSGSIEYHFWKDKIVEIKDKSGMVAQVYSHDFWRVITGGVHGQTSLRGPCLK